MSHITKFINDFKSLPKSILFNFYTKDQIIAFARKLNVYMNPRETMEDIYKKIQSKIRELDTFRSMTVLRGG